MVLDYQKWKNCPLKFINFLRKYTFLHTMEIHNFVTVGLMVFFEAQGYTFGLVIWVTFMVSFYEHFRKGTNRNIELAPERFQKQYIYLTFRIYWYIYWAMFIL